jgi:hypothetical protein
MTMRGEKVYECDFDVTGVTDFGITLDAILSGKEKIRADGRLDLDTTATVETTDGHRIALSASGVGTPRTGEPMADLFENVRLSRLPWTTLGCRRVRPGPWAK